MNEGETVAETELKRWGGHVFATKCRASKLVARLVTSKHTWQFTTKCFLSMFEINKHVFNGLCLGR